MVTSAWTSIVTDGYLLSPICISIILNHHLANKLITKRHHEGFMLAIDSYKLIFYIGCCSTYSYLISNSARGVCALLSSCLYKYSGTISSYFPHLTIVTYVCMHYQNLFYRIVNITASLLFRLLNSFIHYGKLKRNLFWDWSKKRLHPQSTNGSK